MHCPRLLAVALAMVLSVVLAEPAQAMARLGQGAQNCLALTMYWEAKGEGADGMRAVASVVLNRVAHPEFPDTVCGVVKQGGEIPPCQFSWWCDGRSDRPVEPHAWAMATRLAEDAMRTPPSDLTRGALFFHNMSVRRPWTRERTVQIGQHIFYR